MPWETVIATVFQAGNRVVINGNGLFVYNGAPTHGNLLFSVAQADGTDPYGNPYVSVATLYQGNELLNLDVVPGVAPQISMVTGAASENEPGSLFTSINNTGAPNESITTFLIGPSSSLDDIRCIFAANSSAANGTNPANGGLSVLQGSTVLSNPIRFDSDTGNWHTISSFLNGWVVGTGGVCRYRKTAFGELEVQGSLNSAGAVAFTFAQLPVGYRPLRTSIFQLVDTTFTSFYYGSCDTSGNLVVNGAAATIQMLFQGTFPLN